MRGRCEGRRAAHGVSSALRPRLHGQGCARPQVEVLRMWPRDTHTVAVRWTLRCAPRLAPGRPHKVLALDGVSEYKFNSRGFIREHSVRGVSIRGQASMRVLRPASLVRGRAALPASMSSLRALPRGGWRGPTGGPSAGPVPLCVRCVCMCLPSVPSAIGTGMRCRLLCRHLSGTQASSQPSRSERRRWAVRRLTSSIGTTASAPRVKRWWQYPVRRCQRPSKACAMWSWTPGA